MSYTVKYVIAFLLGFFTLSSLPARAQVGVGPVGADSVQSSLFPALAYDSDIGLVGGGLFSRIDYTGNAKPFNNYIKSTALISTKGMFNFEFEYDQTQTFGTDIRSNFSLFAYRFKYDYYFGIGNNSTFNEQQFDDDFYFFESKKIALAYEGRQPLSMDANSRLDLLFGIGTKYEIPYVKQEDSKFSQDLPKGITGGWINAVSTGLIWENRNSEFDPISGNRAKLKVRAAPEFLLSDYGLITLESDIRQYFRLFNWVTVANRLQARHATGDIPYWERSALGNNETLRGYPLNRFIGNSSIAYSLEFRKWVFIFPEYQIKLGGHLFTDVGRVFTEQDDWGDLFSDYKQTVGIGGAMSLFSPDFILRGEAGFSEDMMRIYVGIGYTF
ncbi:BamA/TamA family outer membrane protein [Aliifodinibius sp. S!AR15-10]|uniref:BamA/TamA family outer membrane protein n=1 Tax=Aliifodinibius sp. S!AR15-10 TaxID=2950437 RepID=UPI00285452B8|nr:BamA/TamA family outer membrane protein [Aliifodinibius sp. S!AR15-10]MDR8392500.1 BamA/TamA family outer membrane protein [Aliifodinibius sp. S!AR15-10]